MTPLLLPTHIASRLRKTLCPVREVDEEKDRLIGEEPPLPHSPDYQSPFLHLEGGDSRTLGSGGVLSCQLYVQKTQEPQSPPQPAPNWLNPPDIRIVGEHPVAAGGFTDIWEGVLNDRKVVIKSYRRYELSNRAQVISRFHNELHICSLLSHQNVVSLIGALSTETHPFGLVYGYMANLDLRQYLQNGPSVRRLTLLTGVARGLAYLHDLGIVHGDLRTINILVEADGTIRIAGFGSASILSHSTPWLLEGGPDQIPHSCAPECVWPASSRDTPNSPIEADDMCAFGLVAWEIFMGRPPLFGLTETAVHSMLSGARPPRPGHQEVSDQVWCMIERCWQSVTSKSVLAGEVVDLLEGELRRISDSST